MTAGVESGQTTNTTLHKLEEIAADNGHSLGLWAKGRPAVAICEDCHLASMYDYQNRWVPLDFPCNPDGEDPRARAWKEINQPATPAVPEGVTVRPGPEHIHVLQLLTTEMEDNKHRPNEAEARIEEGRLYMPCAACEEEGWISLTKNGGRHQTGGEAIDYSCDEGPKEYAVRVGRTIYQSHYFYVTAENEEDASEQALNLAYEEDDWDEDDVDYSVIDCDESD